MVSDTGNFTLIPKFFMLKPAASGGYDSVFGYTTDTVTNRFRPMQIEMSTKGVPARRLLPLATILAATLIGGCTQETQNKLGRAVQNWTGTNGVLEIYAGDKLVKRFMKIDKLSTATGTQRDVDRPYRFGYGVLDANLNNEVDPGEDSVYFEFSDYSTSYIFFEQPD